MAERTCASCSGPLPAGATRRRIYCCQRCIDVAKSHLCASCGSRIWRGGGPKRDQHRPLCGRCARPARPPQVFRPGPIRGAIEGADPEAIVAAIRDRSAVIDTGCWEWLGPFDSSGYPRCVVGGSKVQGAVHRVVLEASLGAPLGTQHAHHKCANRTCVNPDHLQPVTHRENMAEMLARHSYLARIRDLERALCELDPAHELLAHIPVK